MATLYSRKMGQFLYHKMINLGRKNILLYKKGDEYVF